MSKTAWTGAAWALIVGVAGAHDARQGAGFGIGVMALAPLTVSLIAGRMRGGMRGVAAAEAQALAWERVDAIEPAQPGQSVRALASPRRVTRLSWTFS